MRLGVLDVGSNTVHLQVVDAHPGARPSPATNQKVELRLHEYLNKEGEITAEGVALLEASIEDAISHAKEFETEEILAFATSAIRDAKNGKEILAEINQKFEIVPSLFHMLIEFMLKLWKFKNGMILSFND